MKPLGSIGITLNTLSGVCQMPEGSPRVSGDVPPSFTVAIANTRVAPRERGCSDHAWTQLRGWWGRPA